MATDDLYRTVTHHFIQVLALLLLFVLGAELLVKHVRTLVESVRLLNREDKDKKS